MAWTWLEHAWTILMLFPHCWSDIFWSPEPMCCTVADGETKSHSRLGSTGPFKIRPRSKPTRIQLVITSINQTYDKHITVISQIPKSTTSIHQLEFLLTKSGTLRLYARRAHLCQRSYLPASSVEKKWKQRKGWQKQFVIQFSLISLGLTLQKNSSCHVMDPLKNIHFCLKREISERPRIDLAGQSLILKHTSYFHYLPLLPPILLRLTR